MRINLTIHRQKRKKSVKRNYSMLSWDWKALKQDIRTLNKPVYFYYGIARDASFIIAKEFHGWVVSAQA